MSNFAPIDSHLPELAALGREAEAAFADSPRHAMTSLRLFGEKLSIQLLDLYRLPIYQEAQVERLRRLQRSVDLGRHALDALHTLRIEGNKAVHAFGEASHKDAMRMLRASFTLVRWYWANHTTKQPPGPGSFTRPSSEDSHTRRALEQARIQEQLEAERQSREASESELERVLRLMSMPQVATHAGLEAAFQLLQADEQEVVSAFLQRFREEPICDAWPLRQPEGMADDKIRFVEVEGLVITVIQPARCDLLIVAHVGRPEDAQAWASTKRFEVNPTIGTLQVFDVAEAEAVTREARGGLFEEPDADLLAVGLPEALLPAVRALATVADLDALGPHLPPEASDGLYLLAAGYSLDQTLTELDRGAPPEEGVDTDDFAVAVQHPESKRSFLVVDGPEDLEAALSGDIEAWRLYLHPDQRKLVRMKANGPIRVLGGAGTGKTVALLHRAKHLLTQVWTGEDEHILVTTYTKNLAADLRHQLSKLVEGDDLDRVDVHNLHALAGSMWSEHGDGRRFANASITQRAWDRALTEETLGLSESFYRAEWEQVIQAQDIEEEVAYLRARRAGRGVSLHRGKRRKAWKVFAAYRQALDEARAVEAADQLRILRRGLESGEIPRDYVSALCDEAQDLGVPELKFLRALIAEGPADLLLVGDAHQRIYGYPVRMGRCGIEIRGRSRRLRVNYRTTARVRDFAVAALTGETFDDLDGGLDSLDGYRSLRLGETPQVHLLASHREEKEQIVQVVRAWLEDAPAEHLCVAAPTNRLVAEIADHLEDAGVSVTVVEADDSTQGAGVRLATFYRLKGLEFPRVLLSGVQEGLMPLRVRAYYELNDEDRKVWDQRQRCLLYVAASRARDELVVTGWGERSAFLMG